MSNYNTKASSSYFQKKKRPMAETARDASSSYFGKAKSPATKKPKNDFIAKKEAERKAKNAGSSSSYGMTSDYATAPSKPKVKKKVNMPTSRSTKDADKVKGTTNVRSSYKKGKLVKKSKGSKAKGCGKANRSKINKTKYS